MTGNEEKIKRLQQIANSNLDTVQFVLCHIALGNEGGELDDWDHFHWEAEHLKQVLALTQQEAWDECLSIIKQEEDTSDG
ncbi:MAG: hypothetical protein ACO23F_05750 [Candidatus Limnocylindrus sp.]